MKTRCLFLALLTAFCGVCGAGCTEADPSVLTGAALTERLNWYGRHVWEEESEGVFFSQSASGFEVRFHGTELRATIASAWAPQNGVGALNPVLAVAVDGETDPRRFGEIVIAETDATEYVLAEALPLGEHTVIVYKKSESAFGKLWLNGLRTDGSLLKCASSDRLQIEVYGDSITCGYGVDSDCAPDEPFSTLTENACKTYAYLAARMLDADLSVLSASGWGMKEGLSPNTELPLWFDRADIQSDLAWTPSRPADLVIIALGANDNQYILNGGTAAEREKRIADYKAAYAAFLNRIFEAYPKVKVLCVYGFLNEGNVYLPIQELAVEFRAQGKTVYDLQVTNASEYPPIGLHGHPGFRSHAAAAEEIVSFLESKRAVTRKYDNLAL